MIRDFLAAIVRNLTGAQRRQAVPNGTASALHAPGPAVSPCVYFANHTSMLDFVVLWSLLPAAERARTRPVAAHDHWSRTALRRWIAVDLFRAVLIERLHVTRANNPLEALFDVLADGGSLILFPEGGRQDGPELRPFKSGIYHLAQRHPHADFVPVFIDNLNRMLPKGEVLPIPLLCAVTFGAPLRPQAGENKSTFLARAQQAVAALGPA